MDSKLMIMWEGRGGNILGSDDKTEGPEGMQDCRET